jgi:hypothetical protein
VLLKIYDCFACVPFNSHRTQINSRT